MEEVTKILGRVCPECGAPNDLDALSKNEYRCSQCNQAMAHINYAANGVVQGIYGWLHNAGDIIDNRYLVKSILGRGGFGVTYLVEDLRLSGKHRAVKVVPEKLYDEYETALLSRLTHPAIPDIIDRGVVEGMVYLVLEFGGNRTLGGERKLHQGRIPLKLLLPWMKQLCEVLIYLHSQDPPIIHRDLKPGNILLDENGRIMLIDFGIAKEAKPATHTRTLGRAESHGFSPPEQAMGTGTDERSDIYSLAATFYALLTGVTPPAAHERFGGKEVIPASQIVPDLPPQIDEVILKGLNFNVNQRFQNMMEFSQALTTISAVASHTHPLGDDTERTVMLNKSQITEALKTHSTPIKLPDGSITSATSVLLSGNAGVEAAVSGRKPWIIYGAVGLGVLLVAGLAYVFWPKPSETTETSVTKTTEPSPNAIAPAPAFPVPVQPTATTPSPATAPAVVEPATAPAAITPSPATAPPVVSAPVTTPTTTPALPTTSTPLPTTSAPLPAPLPAGARAPESDSHRTEPQQTGKSAMDIFREQRSKNVEGESEPSGTHPVEVEPVAPKAIVKTSPKPKFKPKPKPKPVTAYEPAPPPPKKTGGDWRDQLNIQVR